jgi:hypothetical protein
MANLAAKYPIFRKPGGSFGSWHGNSKGKGNSAESAQAQAVQLSFFSALPSSTVSVVFINCFCLQLFLISVLHYPVHGVVPKYDSHLRIELSYSSAFHW